MSTRTSLPRTLNHWSRSLYGAIGSGYREISRYSSFLYIPEITLAIGYILLGAIAIPAGLVVFSILLFKKVAVFGLPAFYKKGKSSRH